MLWVTNNSKGPEEVEKVEVEVYLPEDAVNMEILLNTRDCVVFKGSMSLTTVKSYHQIKWILHGKR